MRCNTKDKEIAPTDRRNAALRLLSIDNECRVFYSVKYRDRSYCHV